MAPATDRHILVRVYGDSLSMPRTVDGVPYTATYAELLRAYFEAANPDTTVHLYNRSRGGQTIKALFIDFAMDSIYFGTPGGDVLVIEVGVVDCAPRPIPGWLKFLISHLPFVVRQPIVKFLHNHRALLLNSGFRFRVTTPRKFRKLFGKWVDKGAADFERVYVLNIAPTTPEMDAHSPGLSAAIEEYNRYIAETIAGHGADNVHLIDVHARVMDEDSGVERYINPADGHHITADGHRMYAESIIEIERAREDS